MQTIPESVYLEVGLAIYDDKQLMEELERRGVKPAQYKQFFAMQYALAQIADHRDEVRDAVYN